MVKKVFRDESGQGLAYVLVIGAVLLVLLVAIVDVIVHEMRWIVGSQKRAVLVHAADAALERSLYKLQLGSNWDQMPLANYDGEFTFTDIPAVRYTIRIQEGNWTPYNDTDWPDEDDYAAPNDEAERTVTIMVSHTKTGEVKKLQALVLKSTLSSALYAGGQIFLGGNAEVYWGPVVSYNEPTGIDLSTTPGPPCSMPSRPIFISRGDILLKGGSNAGSCPGKNCDDPYAGVCVHENASKTELADPPPPPIDTWRTEAIKLTALPSTPPGTQYYFSGASWSFPDMVTPPWPPTKAETVIFFDTTDGLPCDGIDEKCDATSTNKTSVDFSGVNCGSGVLVIMGDLNAKGTGNCSWSLTPPSDCAKFGGPCTDPTAVSGGFWDGFIYVGGEFDWNGNKKLYGTMAAGSLGSGSGNLQIWFKSDNQTLGYLGQSVFIKYWRERKTQSWDSFP